MTWYGWTAGEASCMPEHHVSLVGNSKEPRDQDIGKGLLTMKYFSLFTLYFVVGI